MARDGGGDCSDACDYYEGEINDTYECEEGEIIDRNRSTAKGERY